MTNEQLKKLEDDLWASANSLRAYGGIKASDYAVPVLGLIFLRFADNRYSDYEEAIEKEFEAQKGSRAARSRAEIAIEKCGFFLPAHSRYKYLLELEGNKRAEMLKTAMSAIEETQDAQFQDVLPKDAYFDIEKKKDDILPQLLRTFADIPKDASGDIFGKIYEYFLGKFSLSEGQKGGEFYTPTSVVKFIVETIEPYKGKIFDPACGSGGMFVQSAKFAQHENHSLDEIWVEGQEFMGETVRLAKMNLMVNNIRGEIAEVNSYETDQFGSYGRYDFVMANPPFNVKSVKKTTVEKDKRFNENGLPINKGNKQDKISDANYLWVSLFATSLNEKGRAGFVMANSASDARGSEYEIRKRVVDSGIVDCMVSMPSNMFNTVTLPATLWFFDKAKGEIAAPEKEDKNPALRHKESILFLDARNVYNQIDRAHREWTDEQVHNLAAIVRLYRGEQNRYLELIQSYLTEAENEISKVPKAIKAFEELTLNTAENLRKYYDLTVEKLTKAKKKNLLEAGFNAKLTQVLSLARTHNDVGINEWEKAKTTKAENDLQKAAAQALKTCLDRLNLACQNVQAAQKILAEILAVADKQLKQKNDKSWTELFLNRATKSLEQQEKETLLTIELLNYWYEQVHWLQDKFPDAQYRDMTGLCKVATKAEYAEEQDYSLNAGRYVGVVFESEKISEKEFQEIIKRDSELLKALNKSAKHLEESIEHNLEELLNG
ncbi:type I restriction-modification system subunit M [Roseivirga sp.]|uniref:type I restriction-modification system subunit M n=1 Tax=Roseivirga sp. TaxID=1964215 RepID=UPI003B51B3D5